MIVVGEIGLEFTPLLYDPLTFGAGEFRLASITLQMSIIYEAL